MRYRVLATDYDGTLAHDGHVDEPIRVALERFLESGRQLVMVTGRELSELLTLFPRIDLFTAAVVENGAMLYLPATKEATVLCEPPLPAFVRALESRRVAPLSVGRAIVATFRPNETIVLDVIRELGLELQVIFNKDAVMVLPSGVNKATGLTAALKELNVFPKEVVAVGDAENDHTFLTMCGCAVAVDNAVPALKTHADIVTKAPRGQGVMELIDRILNDDLPPARTQAAGTQVAEHVAVGGKAG